MIGAVLVGHCMYHLTVSAIVKLKCSVIVRESRPNAVKNVYDVMGTRYVHVTNGTLQFTVLLILRGVL